MEEKLKNKSFNSIKGRIISNYLILFVIALLVFEIFLVYSVRFYYYSTVEGMLRNQAQYSVDLFSSNMADESLNRIILEDRDHFYRHNDFGVQILDNSGKVLLDTLGTDIVGKDINSDDVSLARDGKSGRNISETSQGEKIMTYAMPLRNRNEQVGIIRLLTTLTNVDEMVLSRSLLFIAVGILLLIFLIIIAFLIGDSIVRPINELIEVARKLADGNFNIRAVVRTNDEVGELGETINFMADSINEKEELKNDFITSVSHELRTPLTSIKGWAVTLQDTAENEITKEGLVIIEKESDRLKSMVEDLLDFSSFLSRKVTIRKENIDLVDLLSQIHRQLMPRSVNLGIDLVLNYDEEPMCGFYDKDRIKQVVINLLDNSLKFTDSGGTVVINLYEKDNNNIIEVIDTGVGISPDEIDLITTKFYKGQNKNSHIGLGLSISEEILREHGGYMTIESTLGEGTKTSCILPKGDTNEDA